MERLRNLGCPIVACDDAAGSEQSVEWTARWVQLSFLPNAQRPAAVFDIDHTLLEAGTGDRIESMCALYMRLRAMGLALFIITARSEEGRSVTEQQLQQAGIDGYRRLFMHPALSPCTNWREAAKQKKSSRDRIVARGYTICCNLGDAWSDHFGDNDSRMLAKHVPRDTTYLFVDPRDGCVHIKLRAPPRSNRA